MSKRGIAVGVVACAAAVISLKALAVDQARIWREHGVAAVTVGADPITKSPINRKFMLAVVGPTYIGNDSQAAKTRTCSAAVLPQLAEDFRIKLWAIEDDKVALRDFKIKGPGVIQPLMLLDDKGKKINPPSTTVSEAEIKKRYEKIDALVPTTAGLLVKGLAKCMGDKAAKEFSLSIVQRMCVTKQCTNLVPIYGEHPSATGFATLAGWVRVRDPHNHTPPLNTLVTLLPSLEKRNLGQAAMDASKWPPAPTIEQQQAQFEAGLTMVRKLRIRYSATVPQTMDIPYEIAIRTLDALENPTLVVGNLRRDAKAELKTASDELSRSRIFECVKFRGLRAPNEVASCSGYGVDTKLLDACLRGDKCLPSLQDKAFASVVMTLNDPDWRKLAENSELPRLGKSLGTAGALVDKFNQCSKSGQSSNEAAIECTLKSTLPADQKKILDCFEKGGKSIGSLTCAAPLSEDAKAAIACQKTHAGNATRAAECMLETKLPPIGKSVLECRRKFPKDDGKQAKCIAAEVLGGDGAKLAVCLEAQQGKVNAKSVACALDGKLPKEAQILVGCVQESGSAAQIAGCVAGQTLPGELGKAAQCLAESQGDPLGTGICMASNDGMNAESRIALQCAASTGGAPPAFATCVAGRLAMKELIQCRGKKFGEQPCFGENNEFRKLGRSLCGPQCDIGPNSVVGQVANVQLEQLKFTVALQESALREGGKLAENIGKEVERGAQNAGKAIEQAGQQAAKAAGGLIEGGRKAAENMARNPAQTVESAVRSALGF